MQKGSRFLLQAFRKTAFSPENLICSECMSTHTRIPPTKILGNTTTDVNSPQGLDAPLYRSVFTHPRDKRFTGGILQQANEKDNIGEMKFSEQIPIPDFSNSDFGQTQIIFKGLESELPCEGKGKAMGPEPEYANIVSGFQVYHHKKPFHLKYRSGVLPEVKIAYETWGELNEDRSNAVLVTAGLSASSHAKSHEDNQNPGWWEKFIGPGSAIDTDKFFVICANNLGGCYGTTGPSSMNPITEKVYGTTFPILSVEDMIRAQFLLLDHLGIDILYGAVGSSLGGMMSIGAACMLPERLGRCVSISACAQSHPSSIALRYLQRKSIMMDPNWNKGYYYNTGKYPKTGMKLAREVATITYRSGPEWDERFGRKRITEGEDPSLCPHFMVESYLDHQGESFSTKFDPNSLIYMSKAMDLFDLGETYGSMARAMQRVACPVMVMGVQTDILFPVWQQREMAAWLQEAGNNAVSYYELNSLYGHDTFLLDLNGVGAGVKGFLETSMLEKGRASRRKDWHEEDRTLY